MGVFAEAKMVLNWVENTTSPGTTDATDAGEQLPTTLPNGRRLLSVQQWADDATGFSSEYSTGTNDYSAWQATGAPNLAPQCADAAGNWIPGSGGGSDPEWLQLSFPCAAYATSIQIYETYSAPFVTRVDVFDPDGVETTVYSGTDTTACGAALEISLAGNLLVKQVKIYTQADWYEEIDAVGLTGASQCPSASPSAEPSASSSAEPSASPSAEPSASPSAAPTIALIYDGTSTSSIGEVVLAYEHAVEAGCCLCTEEATAAYLLAVKDSTAETIKVEMSSCTEARRASFTYSVAVTAASVASANAASTGIASSSLVAHFNARLAASSVNTTVTSISTSTMVVTQADSQQAVGWIIVLTVVCIVVMSTVIGAVVWKLRSQQQHADQAVGAEPTKTPT